MKSVIAFAASGLCGAAMAFPEVSDVSMTQDEGRLVTITYALSEPAVVTFDILTNNTVSGKWESIGVERFDHATGDAGKLVAAGVGKSIVWQPRYDWPGQKITGGNVKCEVKAWPTNAPPPFMAVSLCNENEVRYYASEAAVPGGVTSDVWKTTHLLMRKMPAERATFRMGSAGDEYGTVSLYNSNYANERSHLVTFTSDYYIGVYPVTQKQYALFNGSNPSQYSSKATYPDADKHPVEKVKWNDLRGSSVDWPANGHTVGAGSALAKLRNLTGVEFDLPTDAQWEFACRAGTSSPLYNGELTSDNIRAIGWCAGNSSSTQPVGLKQQNGFGLYDMVGNVYEWCLDWLGTMPTDAVVDPEGPANSSGSVSGKKVLRGGSHLVNDSSVDYMWRFRSASRYNYNAPDTCSHQTGCRLAAPAEAK